MSNATEMFLNRTNIIDFEQLFKDEKLNFMRAYERKLKEDLEGRFVEFVGFDNKPGPIKWFLKQETARVVKIGPTGTLYINGHEVLDGKVEVS